VQVVEMVDLVVVEQELLEAVEEVVVEVEG
jgi:hypothetical protein